MNILESQKLFDSAQNYIPGGVNSPVRAFRHVGGTPRYIVKGEGAYIEDADGNRYLDFCGSWGPMILGHAHPDVVAAVQQAATQSLSFGACTPAEVTMAKLLSRLVPAMEQVRLVTSGTEATMTALRLARAFTHHDKVIKFEGCYHGHADPFLIAAGSGLLTGGIPDSSGVTAGVAADTLVARYNDLDSVRTCMEAYPNQIACIIVEPVPGNMGVVLPEPDFLKALCQLAHDNGALIIFDEVINAFRFAPTAYSETQGLRPDLITLGKIIGGGLPIGAVGGRAEIMQQLAPVGPVYQAGTLSGNPVALAAGITTLRLIESLNPFPLLHAKTQRISDAINALFIQKNLSGHCAHAGALFTIFFTDHQPPLRNLSDIKTCDTQRFATFFNNMLERGFYLSPSQFEACFVSLAHSDSDIDAFLVAVEESLV